MYCPVCGAKNDDHAVFCENCGHRIQDDTEDLSSFETADLSSFETADLSGQETKVYGGRSSTMDTQVYDDLSDVRSQIDEEGGGKFSVRSIRRSDLISVIVAVAAVILCAILFNVWYGAKPVAQKYAEALFERDWNTVYDCISHDRKGDFLTKENFVTAETVGAFGSSETYQITGITVGLDDLENKTYYVSYTTADESDTLLVSLKRNGLFWEVDNTDYVADTYALSVPTGASVSVDKVELSGKYKTGTSGSRDFYTISPIYGHTHYVEVSGAGLEETAQIVSCYSSDPVEVEVGLDKDTAENIAQQAEEDLKSILEAAARNQKSSSVSVINNMNSDTKEDATYEYDYIRDTVFGYQDNHMELTSYQLSDMEACVYTLKNSDGRDFLQVDIQANTELNYNKVNYLLGNGPQSTTGTCTCSLYYIKNGTSWLLYSIDLNL